MTRAGLAVLLTVAVAGSGASTGRAQETPSPAEAPLDVLEALDRAVRFLAGRCSPAVARVDVERAASLRIVAESLDEQRRLEEVLRRAAPRESITATGFLADADGLVLTTLAAADRTAEAIRVTFPSGVEREARLLGGDPLAGVAVLRIDPVEGIEALRFSAAPARAGAVSLLLARTAEEEPTIALGFVTALDRAFGLYDGYLLASVRTAPGDAGGPLLDARGEVLGMAVPAGSGPRGEIRPVPGAFPGPRPVGLGGLGGSGGATPSWLPEEPVPPPTFVPASELRRILDEVVELGRVRRGMLGVRLVPDTTVISEVPAGLPAAAVGIAPGDRILSVDGRAVPDARRLVAFVQRRAPGTGVTLRVRDPGGREREVLLVLDEYPEPSPPPAALFNGIGVREEGTFDLSGARFSVEAVPDGRYVVVRTVSPGSPAAVAGILAGDWIVEIEGEPVLSEADYVRLALDGADGRRRAAVTIYRRGEADRRIITLK